MEAVFSSRVFGFAAFSSAKKPGKWQYRLDLKSVELGCPYLHVPDSCMQTTLVSPFTSDDLQLLVAATSYKSNFNFFIARRKKLHWCKVSTLLIIMSY